MRLGGTKAGKQTAGPSHGSAVLSGAIEIPADLKPLEDAVRANQAKAVEATLERIRDIQTEVYDRRGKIKRAKIKAAVLALRWEGFGPDETARILGVSRGTVDLALMQMRKAASLDDEIKRVDELIVPIAVDNLAKGVINGDKEYTLRVLDGRGVLRSFKSSEATVTRRDLKLHVVTTLPPHHQDAIPTVKANGVFGVPKRDGGALAPTAEIKPDPAAGTRSLAPTRVTVPDSL